MGPQFFGTTPIHPSSGTASLTLTPQVPPWLQYLEGHGDLESRLVIGITGVITWLIGVISH